MKNKLYLLLITFFIFPNLVGALTLDLHSKYALIYDPSSEEILSQKGEEEKTKIASLTKIMTTIVAIENIKDVNEEVVITREMLKNIPWDASIAGLKVGDRLTFEDLLYASLLPSGADATMSLAYLISGSVPKYVELMNEKAKNLGLVNTHFVNVTGYDATGHESTPKEILKLLIYSLENEEFKKIYTSKTHTMKNGKTINSTLSLYNKFYNYDLTKVLGSKTGYTDDAGMCMSALIDIHDRELIIITLGAEVKYGTAYNLVDTKTIIDALDTSYENHPFFKDGEELFTIPVKDSKETSYIVKPSKTYLKFIEKNKYLNEPTYSYKGAKKLSFKNKKGETIGHIKYYYEGELLGEEEVILEDSFHIDYIKYFAPKILIIFAIIIFLRLFRKKRKRKRILLKEKRLY